MASIMRDVRVDYDHDGEEALFIDAILKPKTPLVEGKIYSAALGALQQRPASSAKTDDFPICGFVIPTMSVRIRMAARKQLASS